MHTQKKNSKANLRQQYLNLRKSATEQQRQEWDRMLFAKVSELDLLPYRTLHIFLPIERLVEPNTYQLKETLDERFPNRLKWVLSKTDMSTGQSGLYHFLWDAHTLIRHNAWGIPEPIGGHRIDVSELDLVFVPLLAYDRKGNRVGYGKGFYDRFLADCRAETLKVGLCWFDPVEEEIADAEATDIPLDLCVTPRGIHYFRQE